MGAHSLFLAITTLEKLQQIPRDFWLKMGGGILAVILLFIIIQRVLKINKFVLSGIVFVACGLIWFNWIYHRTEPKFLTPVINRIAPFFPTAGAYEIKQASTPGVTPTPTPRKK